MYNLSRVILPNIEFIDNMELFVNITQKQCFTNKVLHQLKEYKFNTWMNIFPAQKYFNYCCLDDLYLNLKINKDCTVIVKAKNYNEAFPDYEDDIAIIEINANQEAYIKIDNPEKYENLYFSLLVMDSEDLEIQKAAWCTSSLPVRDNKLAIVTCTFKRENYVKKNIMLFEKFLIQNPELQNKISMFVIDNGKTLSDELGNSNIKIIPNKNAGGAGGFTRGIIECLKTDFSQILLMDDDVLVFTESFFRTLVLSNYLKPEFKNSFIHGAMLDLYNKDKFFESTAVQTTNWVKSYHGKLNISKISAIANTNNTPACIFKEKNIKASSAWWYCCFSREIVEQNGLPLPVFFRCDDIEWSWRNFGEHHITMNGICVWHTPFEWRVSKPVEYYFSKRNFILANMIHTENYKKTMQKMLKKDFRHLLYKYDYSSCEIYLEMMKDLLLGDKTFKEDPEELLKRIFSFVKNDKIVQVNDREKLLHVKLQYRQYVSQNKKYKRKRLFRNFINKTTFYGKLIPKIFWKSEHDTWLENVDTPEFALAKRVNVYNLLTNKIEVREINTKKAKELQQDFNKIYKQISKEYDSLVLKFKALKKECTQERFWKKYLGVS